MRPTSRRDFARVTRVYSPPWSEDEVDFLLDCVKKKYTSTQISSMMKGRTRNAVLGKLNKLQVSLNPRTPSAKTGLASKLKKAQDRAKKPKGKVQFEPRPAIKGKVLPGFFVETKLLNNNPVRLTELKVGQCKQPVKRDDEGEWLMCAEPRCHDMSPYCRVHHDQDYRASHYNKHQKR